MSRTPLAILIAALSLAASAPSLVESTTRLNQPGRSDDLPFTHVVVAGDTVYLSGGLGLDPETGQPPEGIDDEIRLLLDGMQGKLALVDLTMDDLVSVQVFCPDLSLYERFNEIYRTYFEEGFPARAFIGSGLLLRGARFEIQGIAVVPATDSGK
jgi:enamine deaminase RidA (YjgF/YER057c/UK114 family)